MFLRVSNLVCHIGVRAPPAVFARFLEKPRRVRAAGAYPQYLYTTGYFKRRVILKQQFTIEKGYYDPLYSTPYSEHDGLRIYIIADCSSAAQNC